MTAKKKPSRMAVIDAGRAACKLIGESISMNQDIVQLSVEAVYQSAVDDNDYTGAVRIARLDAPPSSISVGSLVDGNTRIMLHEKLLFDTAAMLLNGSDEVAFGNFVDKVYSDISGREAVPEHALDWDEEQPTQSMEWLSNLAPMGLSPTACLQFDLLFGLAHMTKVDPSHLKAMMRGRSHHGQLHTMVYLGQGQGLAKKYHNDINIYLGGRAKDATSRAMVQEFQASLIPDGDVRALGAWRLANKHLASFLTHDLPSLAKHGQVIREGAHTVIQQMAKVKIMRVKDMNQSLIDGRIFIVRLDLTSAQSVASPIEDAKVAAAAAEPTHVNDQEAADAAESKDITNIRKVSEGVEGHVETFELEPDRKEQTVDPSAPEATELPEESPACACEDGVNKERIADEEQATRLDEDK